MSVQRIEQFRSTRLAWRVCFSQVVTGLASQVHIATNILLSLLIVSVIAPSPIAFAQDRTDAADCKELEYLEEVDCYVSILEIEPCDRDAFFGLTWAMAQKGQWDRLLENLALLSEIAPDSPHFLQMRAQVFAENLGDPEAADRELKKAEGLKRCLLTEKEELLQPLPPIQENADEILRRANLRYSRFQDYEGAAHDYETYLSLVVRPEGPSAFHNLAGARRQLGDLSGAIDALSQEMSLFPERARTVLPARARLFREVGDPVSELKDLAALSTLVEEGDLRRIETLSVRIANDPDDIWALHERGRMLIKVGDFDGAIEDASDAILLNPSFSEAYELRAKAKASLGDSAGAKNDRVQAVKCRNGATQ